MAVTRTTIVRCSECSQNNLLRPRSSSGYYSCAKCGSRLQNQFKLAAVVRLLTRRSPCWPVLRPSMFHDLWKGLRASLGGGVALALSGVGIWAIIVHPLVLGRSTIDRLDTIVLVLVVAGLLLRHLKHPAEKPTRGEKETHNVQYSNGMGKRPPRNLHYDSSN